MKRKRNEIPGMRFMISFYIFYMIMMLSTPVRGSWLYSCFGNNFKKQTINSCCENMINNHDKLCGHLHKEQSNQSMKKCKNEIRAYVKEHREADLNILAKICEYAPGKTCRPRDITTLLDANLDEYTWKILLDALPQKTCRIDGQVGKYYIKTLKIDHAFDAADPPFWQKIVTIRNLDSAIVNDLLCCPEILTYLIKHNAEISKVFQYRCLFLPFCKARFTNPFLDANSSKFLGLVNAAFGRTYKNRMEIANSVVSECLNANFGFDEMIYILKTVNNEYLNMLAVSSSNKDTTTWTMNDVMRYASGFCFRVQEFPEDYSYQRCLLNYFDIGCLVVTMNLNPRLKIINPYQKNQLKEEDLNNFKTAFTKDYKNLLMLLKNIHSSTECTFLQSTRDVYYVIFSGLMWEYLGGVTNDRYKKDFKEIYNRFKYTNKDICAKMNVILDKYMEAVKEHMKTTTKMEVGVMKSLYSQMIKEVLEIPLERNKVAFNPNDTRITYPREEDGDVDIEIN